MDLVIAVTNRHLCSHPLTEQIERICRLHPGAVLLREKDLSESDYKTLAQDVMKICETYRIPCILHTHMDVARELNSSFLHLPLPLFRKYHEQTDGFAKVGTSVHSVEEALEAEKLGASYLIAGHIYATDCKKGIPPRGPEFLRTVCQTVHLPVYAIGGIRLEEKQLQEVVGCGAAGGCIMSGTMSL